MIRSKTWPKNTKKNGSIRIFGQNVNGVSYFDNYSEWKIILETLHTQQCDVTCLTEMNIDVKNPEVKYALVHQAKMLDKNSHIIMTASWWCHDACLGGGRINPMALRGGWFFEEEEEFFQWDSGRVVTDKDQEVCDATIVIIMVVPVQDTLFYSLAEALVKGEDDSMEDDYCEDRREGAILIDSFFH